MRRVQTRKTAENGQPLRQLPASQTEAPARKRGIGRPSSGVDVVGREALIDVACKLLEQMSPDKVSRAAVARGSGVDPSLIRYYFKTRSSLLVAAAQRVTEHFSKVLERNLARSDPSPEARLRARIAAQIEMHVDYPFFHRLIVESVVHSDTAEARELFDQITARALASYEDILAEGVGEGKFQQTEPVFLFVAVTGIVENYISAEPILRYALGKKYRKHQTREAYVQFVTDMVLNGLRVGGVRL